MRALLRLGAQAPRSCIHVIMADLFRTIFSSVFVWARPNVSYALRKKQPLVWLLAGLIGIGTSLAAIAFREMIGAVQWTWLGTMSEQVASAARVLPWYTVVFRAGLGRPLGRTFSALYPAAETPAGRRRCY
jgi:hypothetical protein